MSSGCGGGVVKFAVDEAYDREKTWKLQLIILIDRPE